MNIFKKMTKKLIFLSVLGTAIFSTNFLQAESVGPNLEGELVCFCDCSSFHVKGEMQTTYFRNYQMVSMPETSCKQLESESCEYSLKNKMKRGLLKDCYLTAHNKSDAKRALKSKRKGK